jgi:hypothetical protein
MNALEDLLRSAVDSLDADLKPGFAQQVKRSAVRRKHRRQTLVAGVAVAGVAAAGTAAVQVLGDQGNGRASVYVAPSDAPRVIGVVDGVVIDLPAGYAPLDIGRAEVLTGGGTQTTATTHPAAGTSDLLQVEVYREHQVGVDGNTGGQVSRIRSLSANLIVIVTGRDEQVVQAVSDSAVVSAPVTSRTTYFGGFLVSLPEGYDVVPGAVSGSGRASLVMAPHGTALGGTAAHLAGSIEVSDYDETQYGLAHEAQGGSSSSVVRRMGRGALLLVRGYDVKAELVVQVAAGSQDVRK